MDLRDDTTIIDVFEDVLGIPFDQRWTKEVSIDVSTARKLAVAVKSFYEGFRFPTKGAGEMRPYVFHSYQVGGRPWKEFVQYEGESYSFAATRDSDILAFLKPFLLYSHGVCFYDPLPGLLDYFQPSTEESKFEKVRLPAVAKLLHEYVKIADLIRHRIVLPLSDEVFGIYAHNDFVPSKDEEREVIDLLASIPRYQKYAEDIDLNRTLGKLIKEQLWLSQRAENRIDLYFPLDVCMPILQGLLRATSHRYNSEDIYEPFAVGVLADLTSLDTSQISVSDILSVRSEGAFEEYRRVLRQILGRLQDQEGRFSDLESEFAFAAREEMAQCDDKIKQLTQKSNVLKETINNLDRVVVGGATGSIGGFLAGSPELAVIGAAIGSALRPLYDIVRGTLTASHNKGARVSLRNHFLVLDQSGSNGRS